MRTLYAKNTFTMWTFVQFALLFYFSFAAFSFEYILPFTCYLTNGFFISSCASPKLHVANSMVTWVKISKLCLCCYEILNKITINTRKRNHEG